ncbi:hypothetical protein H8356DRAFT_1329798 [Neocallimastix lanati (nom. inval.)]|nr:hypothetical protein H8356DRAFT_1329798 [Neocallimastix sp. JGI-2020a]
MNNILKRGENKRVSNLSPKCIRFLLNFFLYLFDIDKDFSLSNANMKNGLLFSNLLNHHQKRNNYIRSRYPNTNFSYREKHPRKMKITPYKFMKNFMCISPEK